MMWENGQSEEDAKMCLAILESFQTGRITPLLKEELKYHIQARRMSEGKTELVVDLQNCNKAPQTLRPDEIEKNTKRREQNRRASERFRNKRKSECDQLQKLCEQLEDRNTELKEEVSHLQAERDFLYDQVTNILQPNATDMNGPLS